MIQPMRVLIIALIVGVSAQVGAQDWAIHDIYGDTRSRF
jgi:hypothetical protein